jgi:tryptophan synthase beta subunit
MEVAGELNSEEILIVNLSGRGDKDIDSVRTKLTTEDTERTEEASKAGNDSA